MVSWDLMGIYPLVMTNIAIEAMAMEIESFLLKLVIFHSYVQLPEGKSGWMIG